MLFLDIETRSEIDLTKKGLDRYLAHPSTDIACMHVRHLPQDRLVLDANNGVTMTEEGCPVFTRLATPQNVSISSFIPEMDLALSTPMLAWISDPHELVFAHNAEFEMNVWERVAVAKYGLPEIDYDRWVCTSTLARQHALPGGLDDALRALGVPQEARKMEEGKALIRKVCMPDKKGDFKYSLQDLEKLYAYCKQDVKATMLLAAYMKRSGGLYEMQNQEEYLDTIDINERGIKIDVELAGLAARELYKEKTHLSAKVARLTGGIGLSRTAALAKFVYDELRKLDNAHLYRSLMHRDGDPMRLTLDKATRRALLKKLRIAHPAGVAERIFHLLKLMEEGSAATSGSKYTKMLDLVSLADDRVRYSLLHAGAGQTQRMSSKGLQLHNFRRDCLTPEKTDACKEVLQTGFSLIDPIDTLSKMLRPTIIPETGKVLIVADWSAMEATVLAWLAGDIKRLEALQDPHRDIYMETATRTLGLPDEPASRMVGKVVELALGYLGGVGALESMAEAMDVSLEGFNTQKLVDDWRRENSEIVMLGSNLLRMAKNVVKYRTSDSPFSIGPAAALADTKLGYPHDSMTSLRLTLPLLQPLEDELDPRETVLCYPHTVLDKQELTALKASIRPKKGEPWTRQTLWPGQFLENITSGICAAMLRLTVRRLNRHKTLSALGAQVVMHVHDEIVMEVPERNATSALIHLRVMMEQEMLPGLVIAAEAQTMKRYGKP